MQFDINKFFTIAEPYYPGGPYSWEETQEVFRRYFEKYESERGTPHPAIRAEQIEKCMRLMPWFSASGRGGPSDIQPEDYPGMIDKYFDTAFNGGRCGRNINHFFSGAIRKYRYMEMHAADEEAQRKQARINKYLDWLT